MFKKPFKVKSNSQLKGSDRKKLRGDIQRNFPSLKEEDLNLILPNKETIFHLKIITHSGMIVFVYCVQKLPIIFEIDKLMFPTVYMLWSVPELVHTFTTHPLVFPIICNGADLMLPGVVLKDGISLQAYGKLKKGSRVSVNLVNNKAPIAVGKAAHSSYDMYMCAGKGKCVEILHYYGDELAKYGTVLKVPELGPAFSTESSTTLPNEILATDNSEKTIDVDSNVDTQTSEVSSPDGEEEDVLESQLVETFNGGTDVGIKDCEIVESAEPSVSMDELLKYSFLKAMRTSMKKVELPLLTSNFYKVHMIPACPADHSLDIKKSSYKKLSNFLDEMVKLNVIQIEEPQKGVQSISKIDLGHELVKGFIDNLSNDKGGNNSELQINKNSAPQISWKYLVTGPVLPLFSLYTYKKKDAVTGEVVQKLVTDYVKTNNRVNPENSREVLLDDVLRSATNTPANLSILSWAQLMSNVYDQMSHEYKVEMTNGEVNTGKGNLPTIKLHVISKSKGKKVTLVSNLELYGVNLAEFSRECQHGAAASTTINTFPLNAHKNSNSQLQIQGNQVNFVTKLLTEKYSIPKRFIQVPDAVPKKKK